MFDSGRLQWHESRELCGETLLQLFEQRPDLFCITRSLGAVFNRDFLTDVVHCYHKPCRVVIVTRARSFSLEVECVEKLHNEVVDLVYEDISNLLGYMYSEKTGELLTFEREKTLTDTVCKAEAISKMTHLEEYKGCVSFVLKDDSLKWFCLQNDYLHNLQSIKICARNETIQVVLENETRTIEIPFHSFLTVCRFLTKAELQLT